ncbi:MAG: zf-HC2 domain-containing protein [Lachnospiraceae bacterium]|nr:zf-HC2 domain-containing protein [Lachnospiraceae bacterium]
MTCKETERLITPYLSGTLNERKTREFIGHIKKCASCYEEMEITYMATIGLERLESGASIDITQEMQKLLQQTEKYLKKRKYIRNLGIVADAMAMVAVAVVLLYQIGIWMF